MGKTNQTVGKKIEILEISEYSKVDEQAEQQPRFAPSIISSSVNSGTTDIIYKGGYDNQAKKAPIPSGIEM